MRDAPDPSRIPYLVSRIRILYEYRHRMRRHRRASVSGFGGRGSPALPRPRSHALRFRKRDRCAGHDGPFGVSLPETAHGWIALALFSEDLRLSRSLRGESAA